MEPIVSPEKWSGFRKVAFRFFGSYFFIYIFPFPFNLFLGGVLSYIGHYFDPLLSWTGRHFLHFTHDVTSGPNGSGDTSYDYVHLFLLFWLAIFACIIWSLLDRKRNNYKKLLYLLKVFIRAYLAYYLLVYGLSKLPNGQFPHPGPWRLNQSYGESSPMGLAWTFLGFSTAFGLFMGFFETIGGMLMMFRRTLLLGACIATTVTCNIVMINFCFDVPVKIFSTHLLLMCLFLIVTDGQRFINFFFLNKPVAIGPITPVFTSAGWRITRILLKSVFGVYIIIMVYYSAERICEYDHEEKSNIYGLYTIDEFVRNHNTIPLSNRTRWQTLQIDGYKPYVTIVMMDNKKDFLNIIKDPIRDSLKLFLMKDSIRENNFFFHKTDSILTLKGIYLQDTFYIKMHKPAEKKFLLTTRGFHWINEYPFNR